MVRTSKKVWVIVLAFVIMAIVIAISLMLALNLGYVYSPTHADQLIKEGELCELTIEYNGANGMPEKEVKYIEAFSLYTFPKVEKDGYKFFCWFCNFVSYQESVPIYAKKIRAIAQFEKDYSSIDSPCALFSANTTYEKYEVGEYSDINQKVVDVYVDGGYGVSIFEKKDFKGKQTNIYYQGNFSGKVGSMKVFRIDTKSVTIPDPSDNTKAELLKTYAPRLWWDENEKYYASSVEFALQHLKRELSPYGYMGVVEGVDSPTYKEDYFFGDKDNMKAYGFIVEKEYKYIDLCYYIYFPYNKAKEVLGMEFGNHIGDWEHVIVRLLVEENSGVLSVTPIFAQYGIHSERLYIPWNELPRFEETHPIGFIANGSHGIWPNAGKNVYKDLFIIKLSDICSEGENWDLWEGSNLETYSYDAKAWTGKGIGESNWNTCFDHDFYSRKSNSLVRWGNFGYEYPIQVYARLQNAPEGPTCKKGVFDYYTIDTRFYY